jgi:ABC-type uncharacterized transport system involved in gliding motility auxiliary subunit
MSFRTTILGLASLLSLCGAIALQAFYGGALFVYAAWALAGGLLALWLSFNRAGVLDFFTRRSTRYGANLALVLFLVLGILVFLNVLAKDHGWRKDITRAGINTLSDQTKKIVSELPQDVKATYFNSYEEKQPGEGVLQRYAFLSKHFTYEFVDEDRNPTRVEAMGVKGKGSVVLSLGDSGKRITASSATEEQITNGLIKLLRSKEVAVYFSNGHDEHPLGGAANPLGYAKLRGELEKQGYTVKELNLLSEGKIPADAALVVVAGPKKAFFPKELGILGDWIRAGGHALLAVDLDVGEGGLAKGSAQLAGLLGSYGVEAHGEMLVDPTSKRANVEPQVILGFSASRDHPVTKDFAHAPSAANFLFPLTAYLSRHEVKDITITPLAVTSPLAWAESDWNSLRGGRVSFDAAKDRRGPLDLAYAVAAKSTKLVVLADSLVATDNLIDKVGNRDLVLNAVAWLADDDRFISIRAKEDNDGLRQFSGSILNLILLVTVFLIPLSLAGVGVLVWWRRSKL